MLCFLLVALTGTTARAQELPPMTARGKPAILSATPNSRKVPRFGKFELTIELSASYDNPFDPEQIDLTARFTSPSGRKFTVAGFFYQPYKNRNAGDDEKTPMLEPAGEPCWKVRFAPDEIGTYAYSLALENRFGATEGRAKSGPATFECIPSSRSGFIRVSPVNRRYFRFDDGSSFFPVGQNLQNDWPRYSHFRPLADAGCNAVRVWTFCHWSWLEWTYKPDIPWAGSGHWMRSYAGAGRYNQRIAWIADDYLARCERDGLHLMLCLGNGTGGGELSDTGRYDSWGGHPYNVSNAGFLEKPKQIWTDERAIRLYKQRMRYIIARYGYSTSVWAWEFWNELGTATPDIVAWHREMSDYVHRTDPHRHLVTTCTWTRMPKKFNAVWDLPGIDFTQSHIYRGPATIRRRVALALHDHPDKPHIIGEGGGCFPGKDGALDPGGIDFHNSLWAAVMSGSAGTTLPWFWRHRIEPGNLFFHYTAVRRFVKDVPWATTDLKPAPAPRVFFKATPPRRLSPVLVAPIAAGWGEKAPRNRFAIEPDGTMPHIEDFTADLFGRGHPDWRNPPTITVNYPAPGKFIVHVSEAAHAVLEIYLDGKPALRDDSLGVPRTLIRRDFSIDVPAGKHEVRLVNAGGDWLCIRHMLLTNYRDASKYPDLDVYWLKSDTEALLWVHNRLNEWDFRAIGVTPQPVSSARVELARLKDGDYTVEWWDTYKGEVTRTEKAAARGESLILELPSVNTDGACKIKRVRQ